jgi:hypothetical protein
MSNDLRKYAKQTNFRLFVGFILILFLVGDGLIYWLWGSGAALLGAVCLLGGVVPLGLIWVALIGLDWIVKRSRDE